MTTTATNYMEQGTSSSENSSCVMEALLRCQIQAFRRRLELEDEEKVINKRDMLDSLDEMEVALDLANMSC